MEQHIAPRPKIARKPRGNKAKRAAAVPYILANVNAAMKHIDEGTDHKQLQRFSHRVIGSVA